VVPPLRAVWIPAKTPHSVVMSGCVSMRTLYFLPTLVRFPRAKCSVINVSPLLRELILHACDFKTLSKKIPSQKALIEMIVAQVASAHAVPLQLPNPVDARATRVARVLLADPSDNRTLEKLCQQCGASKRTMQRIFLSETRMSFVRWRQQLRLLRAMQGIASGEKVSSAALDAGYSSPSAFTAMFRKQLGTTPRAYFTA
jgi:AraC-like DNA-binding protein